MHKSLENPPGIQKNYLREAIKKLSRKMGKINFHPCFLFRSGSWKTSKSHHRFITVIANSLIFYRSIWGWKMRGGGLGKFVFIIKKFSYILLIHLLLCGLRASENSRKGAFSVELSTTTTWWWLRAAEEHNENSRLHKQWASMTACGERELSSASNVLLSRCFVSLY